MRPGFLRVAAALSFAVSASAQTAAKPWPVRVVVVTTFQPEFTGWQQREHLDETVPFAGGVEPLRTNKEHTVLGMVSGMTLVNATASMMALGLDPRFDLTHAYILINGIAGVDPKVASLGSAAWAKFVVGDISRMADLREAPKDWPYGWYPAGATGPNPATIDMSRLGRGNIYPLNGALVDWAYAKTKDLKLEDDPRAAKVRTLFTEFPEAQRPPFVLIGDSFASDVFWHGAILTQFARDWVRLWTGGKGRFAMTEMEDSGFMEAVERLHVLHRLNRNRVLVLRTGSNYSQQEPGLDAIAPGSGGFAGGRIAFANGPLVGGAIVDELLANWATVHDHSPGGDSDTAPAPVKPTVSQTAISPTL